MAVPRVRLMLGAEPPAEALRPRRHVDETEGDFERRRLREGLRQLNDGLRAERDRMPFARASAGALHKLVRVLNAGRMEVRRYENAFLHAKVYIVANDPGATGIKAGVIVGSSNLTSAGLTRNLELNLGRFDHPVVEQVRIGLTRYGKKRSRLILRLSMKRFSPSGSLGKYTFVFSGSFMGKSLKKSQQIPRALPLTSFQAHGVARTLRLMSECGGAIVADEVGLGKTFIAGEIVRVFQLRRQRALLICPAALRDTTWRKFKSKFELYLDTVSYEELANERQMREALHQKNGVEHLDRNLDEYQLIVVDEAHNYRNPDAPTRAVVLRQLLFGKRATCSC